MKKFVFIASLLVAFMAMPVQAAFLFSEDFDGGTATAPGVSASVLGVGLESATAGGWNAAGWAGNYAVNRSFGNPAAASTLLLSGLPSHTTISASFILGFLESWDSNAPAAFAPEELEVYIDGVLVATMTSNNAQGPTADFDGGTVIASGAQTNSNTFFTDTLVDMSTAPFLTFAHSASTLQIDIRAIGAGWQGGGDEAWGIDNIHLEFDGVRAVPEPASMALLLTGIAGLGLRARNRKSVAR